MDLGGPTQPRLVGNYILGPKIGSGSFAVVWRSTHRQRGIEVAVKEIDKKLLSSKVSENLLKEISILSTIDHPNIIRLFEAIENEDKIYLVLEYCDGGDLGDYIRRHGKVSEHVARHFMRQLAAGLQVLQEKHLIHRDLKPQNLLLSTKDVTPVLKIGDFGFARSLTPQDLADTLCGSPLYMAPEIIQNQKYDAKADLWSVGAILFQLVTGKPPFDGNNQLQLFQKILASTELQFPEGALGELHPDCVALCRSLLRRNPVERLTFKEFFSHKFLVESRQMANVEMPLPQSKVLVEQFDSSLSEKRPQLHSGYPVKSSSWKLKSSSTTVNDAVSCSSSSMKGACGKFSIDQPRVTDSMESIERDYVLVNPHYGSTETFSYHLETSVQDSTGLSNCQAKKNEQESEGVVQKRQFTGLHVHGLDSPSTSSEATISRELQGLSIQRPLTGLHLLHQYVHALTELAHEQYNAGLFPESFSVELVILAIWKKALQICSSWMASTGYGEPGINSAIEPTGAQYFAGLPSNSESTIDFTSLSSACTWAEEGFVTAFDRTEKQSYHLQDMDASAEMPDAMDIIYQRALAIGKSGAVDEYMGNRDSAVAAYSKAKLLLSFIVGEAMNLPLNPPFSLTPTNEKLIQSYIKNLQSRQSNSQMPVQSPKQSTNFGT
ncbi:hypothetical protein SLE2022_182340 [Rubroshorea leprosula]